MSKAPPEMNLYHDAVRRAEKGGPFFGKTLHVYPTLDSTMRVADEMIAQDAADGMTVVALEQTAGRGSGDRKWQSGKGNAMFSRVVALRPGECGQEMEMIAACAVAEIMRVLLPHEEITLKYPNDVLIGGRKICGCLVPPACDHGESIAPNRKIILGVGVNLGTAPSLPNGNQSASLAGFGVAIGIGSFLEKFDDQFAEVLAYYRQEKNFNPVLFRMGFLDSGGMMTLTENACGEKVRGAYDGFATQIVAGKPAVFIRLQTGDGPRLCAAHNHSMAAAPPCIPSPAPPQGRTAPCPT